MTGEDGAVFLSLLISLFDRKALSLSLGTSKSRSRARPLFVSLPESLAAIDSSAHNARWGERREGKERVKQGEGESERERGRGQICYPPRMHEWVTGRKRE